MLDIKTHLTYKYEDRTCRGCKEEEEKLEHIVNCGVPFLTVLDVGKLDKGDDQERIEVLTFRARQRDCARMSV